MSGCGGNVWNNRGGGFCDGNGMMGCNNMGVKKGGGNMGMGGGVHMGMGDMNPYGHENMGPQRPRYNPPMQTDAGGQVITLAEVLSWLEHQQSFVLQSVMMTCKNLLVTKHSVPIEDMSNGLISKSSVLNPVRVLHINKMLTDNAIKNNNKSHSKSRGHLNVTLLKENKVASFTDNTKQNDTTVLKYNSNNDASTTCMKSKVPGEKTIIGGRYISRPQNGNILNKNKQSKTVKGKTYVNKKVPEEVKGVKLIEVLAKRKSTECKSGGRSWSSRARRTVHKLGSDRYPNPRPDRIYNIDVDGHDIDAYDPQ